LPIEREKEEKRKKVSNFDGLLSKSLSAVAVTFEALDAQANKMLWIATKARTAIKKL